MCHLRVRSVGGMRCGLFLIVVVIETNAYVETGDYISELDKPVVTVQVEGVVGKTGALPCDIQPRGAHEQLSMVLWFKEADGEPLYSYDVRSRPATHPKLWSSPTAFGSRAFFRAGVSPALLLVDGVTVTDAGLYRCRVDFYNSPTRNTRLNFTVIVPPSRPQILDAKTRDPTKLLEPCNEGDTLQLICEVQGGEPKPKVVWCLENTVIDESYELRPDGVTVNQLAFPRVGRQHLNNRLLCQASNTNLTPPLIKVLILDINLKPLSVAIVNKGRQLSADKTYEVVCITAGSRPAAVITWWRGTRLLKNNVKFFSDTNLTRSVLTLTPQAEDHGQTLACRVWNPRITSATLEDTWLLDVHYLPVVMLKLGSNLNPNLIREGDDVYFECSVRSNPKHYKLVWYKENQELRHNPARGIIVSEHRLVVQHAGRAWAGDYSCRAHNAEGGASSQRLSLHLAYAPTCNSTEEQVYEVLKDETVTLRCVVDSNPPPTSFTWTLNSSDEQTLIPDSAVSSSGLTSAARYRPHADADSELTASCRALNAVGTQSRPCLYRLVPAGPPPPVHNCSSVSVLQSALQVRCTAGRVAAPLTYFMEVLELPDYIVRHNVSNSTPTFVVRDVVRTATYTVRVYAVRGALRSQPVIVHSTAAAHKLLDSAAALALPPLAVSLLSLGALLAACACAALLAWRRRHSQRTTHDDLYMDQSMDSLAIKRDNQNTYCSSPKLEYPRRSEEKMDLGAGFEDVEPDIIPYHYDKISPAADPTANSHGEAQLSTLLQPTKTESEYLHAGDISRTSRGVTARTADITAARTADVTAAGTADVTAARTADVTAARTADVTAARTADIVTTSRRLKESCI